MNIFQPLSPHLPIYKPQLTSTFPISHRISGAFLATILLFFYLLCLKIGETAFFFDLLTRCGVSLGGRALSFFFIYKGLPAGIAFFITLLCKAFIFTNEGTPLRMHMNSSGGEGTGGGSFGWTSLFGSSSTGNSEASVNQPAPDSPNPGAPAAPIFPDVFHPLQEDGHRRQELNDRLGINSIGRSLSSGVRESILETQLQIEKKIERALRSDGYSGDSILSKRHQIRGILFYPHGTAFSFLTYKKHLHSMEEYGTHRSLPYQRLMESIYKYDLQLN